jgi:hypothetical protein
VKVPIGVRRTIVQHKQWSIRLLSLCPTSGELEVEEAEETGLTCQA